MPRRNIYFILIATLLCVFIQTQTSLPERVFQFALRKTAGEALEETDRKSLLEGALDGMMKISPYYPYTAYLPSADEPAYEDEIQGIFAGIGIYHMAVDRASGELWFTPIENSPAQRAGLLFGDRITAVDGKSLEGMSVEEVSELLRGPEGSTVRLTVRSWNGMAKSPVSDPRVPVETAKTGKESATDSKTENGTKLTGEPSTAFTVSAETATPPSPLREIEITRGTVYQDIVLGDRRRDDGSWEFTLETDPEIGFIRIDQFTDVTGEEFGRALDEVIEKGIRGLILDLRGNPGGFLMGAFDVCNRLLPAGSEIVTTQTRKGEVRGRLTAEKGPKFDKPIVVLLDDDSASAAEIVAGALADHHRATLVGTRSYGKGTVQELISLPCDMGLLRLTDASFCRPSGEPIHRKRGAKLTDVWGVTPTPGFEIPLSPAQETAMILFRDLRSCRPVPEQDRAGLDAVILARATSADLFTTGDDWGGADFDPFDSTEPNDSAESDDSTESDPSTDPENKTETDDGEGEKTDGGESSQADATGAEKKSGEPPVCAEKRILGTPPYYDPQLDRAIEIFHRDSPPGIPHHDSKPKG